MLTQLLAILSVQEDDLPRARWLLEKLLWVSTMGGAIIAGLGLFAMSVSPEEYWQLFLVSLLFGIAMFILHGKSRNKPSAAMVARLGHLFIAAVALYIVFSTPPGLEHFTFVLYIIPITVAAALFAPPAGFVWAAIDALLVLLRALLFYPLEFGLFGGIFLTLLLVATLSYYLSYSFHETQRRLRLQVQKGRAGIEIGRTMLGTLEPAEIAAQSVRLIQEAFGYHQVALFLLPPGNDKQALLADAAGADIANFKARSRPVPVSGRTAVANAIRYGKPMMVVTWRETIGPNNRRVEFTYKRIPARAELALPLLVGERVVGAMDLYSVDMDPFPEADVHILEGLASHVAHALGLARLVDDLQRQHEELTALYSQTEQRTRYLEATADLAQAISTLAEPQELLDRAVNIIRERLGHRHIGVFLVDDSGAWAVLTAASSEEGQELIALGHKYPVEEDKGNVVGTVISTAESQVIAHESAVEGENWDAFHSPATRTEAVLPLRAGGKVIGALDVQNEGEPFGQEDIAMLQILADQVAMAVENARLFQSTQRALEEVRAIQRYYVSKEWERLIGRRADLQAEYRGLGVPPLPTDRTPEMDLALEQEAPLALSDLSAVVEGEAAQAVPRSALVVPVKLRDEVIGVLDLQELDEERQWTQDEIEMATAVADQLALAMENARLFEEAQRRAAQLAAAAEVARDATSILDVEQLLNETVHLISEQFGFYHAGVFLLDEAGEYAVLQAASSEGGQRMLARGHKLRVGKVGIVGKVAATGEPHIALDVGKDAVHFANPDLPDTHSEMGLPLRVRGRVIGVLDVQSTRVAAFTEDDVAVLQTLADQLAAAIANARLFRAVREEASRRALINEVLHAASTSLDPGELLHQAGEVISRRLNRPSALFVWSEDEEVLRPVAIHNDRGDDVPVPPEARITREMAPALFEEVIDRQSPARLRPLADHLGPYTQMMAQKLGIKVGIYVPLLSRDRLLGVLVVALMDDDPPGIADFVEVVGANLSVALENARLYQEAIHTAERLKEMDRLKSQFLANMSHELRTPLNSIIGFSRVILKGIDGPLTDMQRTDLQAVYDSGQHLLGLINDILDISKIQAGKMELSFEDTDLRDIIKGVMSTAIALVKDKPIELQQVVAPDLPIVRADSRRIRQVLLNLVGNAAKFTEEGFIRIEATYNKEENRVLLAVADSGIGIPPDKIDTIFEEFTQVDGSSTRRAGGTGLGLSISRHFVEMHGGRIWVESTLGEGSTFYVELPVEGPPPPGEEPEEPKKKKKASPTVAEPPVEAGRKLVLCVDDDAGVITLFRRYLGKHGYQVVGITDSTAVLERARQLQPFAITLDVLMPDADGWTVMQELKSDPATRHIPVIVCSIVSEKDKGLSMGASDYLIKPILEDDLVRALERLDRTAETHLVLVVDDNDDDRALLRRLIENLDGYEVIEAAGGEEAILLVKERHPDIITLDLMMPEIDGFAVLESIKADPETRSIPIIVVTAKDLTPEEREKLNQGVEALLQKGLFRQQELLADVAAALDRITAAEKAQSPSN